MRNKYRKLSVLTNYFFINTDNYPEAGFVLKSEFNIGYFPNRLPR